jgi:transposase-like protein
MNELRIFEISKKRTLIAMQEWLRKWQMPLVARVYCPNCKSQKVNKRMQAKQGKTHRCSECQRDFSLEELAECRCTYPGGLLKCIDCKHYQDMMRYVERRKAGLERLSEEQLDAIMSARNFGSGIWRGGCLSLKVAKTSLILLTSFHQETQQAHLLVFSFLFSVMSCLSKDRVS